MITTNEELGKMCKQIRKLSHACKIETVEFCFKGLYGDVLIESKACKQCNKELIEFSEKLSKLL